MARLKTLTWGYNSTTAGIEFTSISGGATIASSNARTGTYCGRINSGSATTEKGYVYRFSNADSTGEFLFRVYFRYDTAPNADTPILAPADSTGNTPCAIMCRTTGVLKLSDNAGSQVGSDSPALTIGQYYRVELRISTTGAILDARLDGVSFASAIGTADIGSTGVRDLRIGINLGGFDSATTMDFYYDDAAINNTSGSVQNSWPGSGKCLRLKPSAAGEVNTFATQTGGTAGAGNNFTRVNEVTPDDATTFNGSSTLNEEDLFDLDDSGMGASDTVSLVQLEGRFRNSTADATAKITFRLEKANAGTKSDSAQITPNSTTFRTNVAGATEPKLPPITLYVDPDAAAWTQTTIDSMRAGYKLTTAPGTAGRRIDVTSLSVIVEYVPFVAPPASNSAAFFAFA